MIATAVSHCSFVTTSGGQKRSVLTPQPSISRPRRKQLCTISSRSVLAGFFGGPVADQFHADHQAQAADVADQPVLGHQLAAGGLSDARPRRGRSPSSSSSSSLIVSRAATQETGLPPNVLACVPGPVHDVARGR